MILVLTKQHCVILTSWNKVTQLIIQPIWSVGILFAFDYLSFPFIYCFKKSVIKVSTEINAPGVMFLCVI